MKPAVEVLQDRGKIAVRIALMKENRFAGLRGDFQLSDERGALGRRRPANASHTAIMAGAVNCNTVAVAVLVR